MKKLLRLNKFLSKSTGCSRRKADEIIKKGYVFVNNKKILSLASFVIPEKDQVRIRHKVISPPNLKPLYLIFNKPRKLLTSAKDPEGRPTVMDYIKRVRKEFLFPVGRLDWDSEGLLILTNDGDFTHKVLHPSNRISKTYLVKVRGQLKNSHITKLTQGVSTSVGKRKALFAYSLPKRKSSSHWVKIIISEGKKRQIRLMFDKMGFPVQRLKRVAIGRLKMNRLPIGAVLVLTEKDKKKIFQIPKELGFSKPSILKKEQV